ncbi:hypothetical protein R2360_13855 [Mycobacteroides chelonae]|nr:hypothetical protein [Mycobacteroides chelonae]MEC4843300.1 hypothetical protein [Mycobacteroides chelonae]
MALTLAGCTPSKPQEPIKKEDLYRVTNRWIPNDSVDLMSPEGTFLRAAAESWNLIFTTWKNGVQAIRERGYPGLEGAFNNNYNDFSFGGVAITKLVVGTQYYEVVNFQRVGNQFVADVCHYSSQIGSQTDDGNFTSGGRIDQSSGANSFVFGPNPNLTPEQQRAPLSHQRGPANRPTDNVFGTWVLTEIGVRKGMDDAAFRSLIARCRRPAPGTLGNPPNPHIGTEPPPMLPPDPGWPDAGSA